jgi:fatty acid desaturase
MRTDIQSEGTVSSPKTQEFRLKADVLMPLTKRRDGPALVRIGAHLTAIALVAGAVLLVRGSWWTGPLIVLLGYLVAFLFNAEHEAAHQTAFRRRTLNHVVGHLAGFAVLLPYEYYRLFHWDHHRFTQDPLRDPELAAPIPSSLIGQVLLWTGLLSWRTRVLVLLKHGLRGQVSLPWVPAEKRRLVVIEARCYLAGYALIAIASMVARSSAALELWLLPLVVGQIFLRPYLLAEHTGCPHSRLMLENTRTTYTNAVVRFFAWDMPYHSAHHAYPAVPFHALAKLNQHLVDHLVSVEPSYRASSRKVLQHLGEHRRRARSRLKAAA